MRACTLLTLSLPGLAVALAAAAAHADFLSSYCGSTRAKGTLGAGIDGTISFAVVDLLDDPLNVKAELLGFTFVPGHGSGGFDDSARYAYLYQAVNDGPNATVIGDVAVSLDIVEVTEVSCWGHFDGVSLSDAQGAVGRPGGLADNRLNAFGDTDDAAFAALAAADTGVTQPGFNTTLTDLETPLLMRVSDHGASDSFTATFDAIHNYDTPNFRSTVFAFTTDTPPCFDNVSFQDGGGQAMGTVASPVSTPSTLTWDGTTNEWGSPHWYDGPQLVSPCGGEDMVVDDGTVTVADAYNSVGGLAANSLSIAPGNHATLDLQAPHGELEVLGDVTVGAAGILNVDGVLTAASVISHGTISGSGTIVAHDIRITGVVSPAGSVGRLTFNAAVDLIEATYLCESDSSGTDLVQNLSPDGPVTLGEGNNGGTLDLLVLGSLGGPGCYPRTILSTAGEHGIDGDFREKPAAGDYLDYGVFLDGYEIVDTGAGFNYNLNLFQAEIGDADGDRDVDLDDLSNLDDGWDPAASDKIWPDGDFDLDGDVDLDDLSALDDHWHPTGYPVIDCPFRGGGDGLGTAPVPEPGTFALLAIGPVVLLLWRRHHRRAV